MSIPDHKFTVFQSFINGTREKVAEDLDPAEAVMIAFSKAISVPAKAGLVEDVIIVDEDDYCVFEWKRGEGVTFFGGKTTP